MILVGIATFLMGCLPTFGQIGYLAPALLVALRFLQGFAVGGEWGGAVLLVAEHSPNRSRAFWASWPQAGVPVGNLIATIVLGVTSNCVNPGYVATELVAKQIADQARIHGLGEDEVVEKVMLTESSIKRLVRPE
ncbi:hypothetical protein GCM10022238_42090 [Gordonia hankookensis]